MSNAESQAIDQMEFRRAMGRFASGITVVTTRHNGHTHGMTANGFMSVSLEPPLVVVSLANTCRLHALLPESGRYGVSVLSESQEPLSRHFAAQGTRMTGDIPFVWHDEIPLLAGALTHLVCTVVDSHAAGDHTLYVGRVEHLDYSNGAPLVFYTGEYGRLDVQLWDHSYIWKPDPWT